MKRLSIPLLLALLMVAGVAGVPRIVSSNRTDVVQQARQAGHGGRISSAIPRLGEVPGGEVFGEESEGAESPEGRSDYLDAKYSSGKKVKESQVRRAFAQAAAVPTANVGSWQMVGPTNVGARVTDLVVDPTQPNTIYVAIASGGIWKSTDAGMTFTNLWPDANTQAMGALARGSDGTLWAGTGEANPSGGGLTYFGDGVYKSVDGGATWQQWGLRDTAAIGRIAVDPTDPNRVFVAAAGSISRVASQRGIYRVTDGQKDWKLVLPAPNDTTGGIDVAIDPANHNRVYAALWDHHRNNGARVYGGVGSGLFRSDDGGTTWTRLENVTGPPCFFDQSGTGLTSDPSLGRIGVVVAPSDPNRVYVVSGSPYGPDKGFYVSNDGGDSFVCGGRAGPASSGYQWWFGRLWIDPVNKDHVFSADINLRESNDGGLSFHNSGNVHADQHAMDWDPNVPNRVYLGNDGGVYRSDGNGANGTWIHATYEPWQQSYHLGVAGDDPTRLVTGTQDNGSLRTWTAATPPPPSDQTQWNSYRGGDGHYTVIDPTDHSYYYACFQPQPPRQNCGGYHDAGGTTTTWSFPNSTSTTTVWPANMRWTTDTPMVLDPSDPTVVYIGGTVLGRSTDRGHTFTVISPPDPDSLPGEPPLEEQDQGPFYANEYGTITAIAPAKTAPNTIYVGTDTGRVWKTTDLGAHWSQFSGLPTRWVNSIVVDPTNADHVFVAFSGYREGDDSANVWTTTNGGASWANISGNLPNAPVEMRAYDQPTDQLYAAEDLGLFYLKNDKKNWARVGTGLPSAPILDVKLSGDGHTIFAATFGRSVWKLSLP